MANEDICIRFGRKLRKLRQQKGWTQSYMAEHTGIGRAHISNLETGKKEVGLRVLEILADSFGMSLPQLLSRL
ncbi:MAG TPA: helix-turn-helix transcriptional regulator [Candidatus Angelobacter sp.]|nr:helix-turn-helix transcriptional regulator [Candidatus Angelobacter sp.]